MSTVPRSLIAIVLGCVACSDAEKAPPEPTKGAAPIAVEASMTRASERRQSG